MYYLTLDGGGSKLNAILFTDEPRLISSARSAGTHTSVYPEETIRANISSCYSTLFENIPRPLHIECLYNVCGDIGLYRELLPEGITVGRVWGGGEGLSGLYAGLPIHSGFVALAGTGSDVFCIENDRITDSIGGWGAIIGDEGSGVWMSRRAMQYAIRAEQSWGKPTVMGELVKKRYGFGNLWEYIGYLYSTPAPFRRLAELLPTAAEAAYSGDELMVSVFRDGGRMMAEQMNALLKRHPELPPVITACGGAWKAHSAMAEEFEKRVTEHYPDAEFSLPLFEHVMAGPILMMMERGCDSERIKYILMQSFPDYVWGRK